ncbi:MAG: hypothetical protein JNL01_16640 [Bdellovibrionales bacterium]|nr:hypothetical protein [Bdellovibrionales bacterium]
MVQKISPLLGLGLVLAACGGEPPKSPITSSRLRPETQRSSAPTPGSSASPATPTTPLVLPTAVPVSGAVGTIPLYTPLSFKCPWGQVELYDPYVGALVDWGPLAGNNRPLLVTNIRPNDIEVFLNDSDKSPIYLTHTTGNFFSYGQWRRGTQGPCELISMGSGPYPGQSPIPIPTPSPAVVPSPTPVPSPSGGTYSWAHMVFVCPWGKVVLYDPYKGALIDWGGAGLSRGFNVVSASSSEVHVVLGDGSDVYLVRTTGSTFAYSYLSRDPTSTSFCDKQ